MLGFWRSFYTCFLYSLLILHPEACGFSFLSSFGASPETKGASLSVFIYVGLTSLLNLAWEQLPLFSSVSLRQSFVSTHHTYLLLALEQYLLYLNSLLLLLLLLNLIPSLYRHRCEMAASKVFILPNVLSLNILVKPNKWVVRF